MKPLKPRPDAHKLLPQRCQIPGKEAPASRTALLSTVSVQIIAQSHFHLLVLTGCQQTIYEA